jgi:predicted TIM-barrel fold metal-dependent hydrolase
VDVEAPLCLPPRPMTRAPLFGLPDGTVDTHFHVFRAWAPLNTPRSYTPQILTIADWRSYAAALGIARGVLVQPSVYGFDNSVLLEALASDTANLRGVVVLPPDTPRGEFARLDGLGVRGVRINTRNKGGLTFETAADFAASLAPLGWSLQFQVRPEQLSIIGHLAPMLGLPVVIDHLGFIALDDDDDVDTHVSTLQRLLDGPETYVKLSAPYRLTAGKDYRAFAAVAGKLVVTHPHRLLWGSDWPHTELWADMPDDADLIEDLTVWLGNDAVRRQVFAETAQSLFFSR